MTTGTEKEKGKDGATTNRGVKFSHLVERQESFEEEKHWSSFKSLT